MNVLYIAILATSALFIIVTSIKPKSTAFYLGSGNYGSYFSAISIVAAFTGGGALINTTTLAGKYGSWAFFDVFPAVLGLALSALLVWSGFFGKRFSQDFFDVSSERYDKRAVVLHYSQVAFLYVLVIAAQLRAVSVVAAQLNVAEWMAVLFCCVVVAIYAFRGLDAVTRTDVAQLILMVPVYIILGYLAFEPQAATPASQIPTQTEMPLSLAFALCLPLFFLPISQEIHQRGAAVATDKKLFIGLLISAVIYVILGSLLVIAFSKNPQLSFAKIIGGSNTFAAVVLAVGFLAAILSTLDTSTNIASHALQKLSLFERLPHALVQVLLLVVGSIVFLYFKTVLSLILFALFLYMAGPALTFVAVRGGVHPRTAGGIGGLFVALQAFFHFRGGQLVSYPTLQNLLPWSDPTQMGLILLLLQGGLLLAIGIKRKIA